MNLSIKKRLNWGFASAILLVLLVGAVSYITFSKQDYEASQVKYSYKVINQLAALQNLVIEMGNSRRGFRSTNEKMFLEPYYLALSKFEPAMANTYALLGESNNRLKEVNQLQNSIRDIMEFWKSIGEDASKNTREIIIGINTIEKGKMDLVGDNLKILMDKELAQLAERETRNQEAVRRATIFLMVGIALILGIVWVLIRLIVREFNSRTKAQEELRTNNQALEVSNKATEEKNWLLAGLAEVNESLHGTVSPHKLANSLLNRMAAYIKINAAAFYSYNADTELFSLISSVGVSSVTKTDFKKSEGFFGAAIESDEPLHIKQLPNKSAQIETGLVKTELVESIYTPLYFNGELKGILEVLTFHQFEDRHVAFMQLVRENIAVAIHSAQLREKEVLLLEKVQMQKEELENQQEELRQANEELFVQTEVLQASEEELRVQEEELRQINSELEEKNKVVETARQALVFKARELENSNKFKSEFLANMSHELRTPLNSILILAKLLSDNSGNNLSEKQVQHAGIIYKSGTDLLQLINNILDLSKIEAGKEEVNVEAVTIKSVARDAEQVFLIVAEEKEIEFLVETDPLLLELIQTDKQKLEQVLKNLLSNAMKFTKKNGKVTLRFWQENSEHGNNLLICVSDTGIGIPADKQQLIFEAFQQADGSTSRKFGGTGLGLSITKGLVKLLGGNIRVESAEGKGCVFTVSLPLQPKETETLVLTDEPQAPDTWDHLFEVKNQTIVPDDRNDIRPGDKVMLIIEDDQVFARSVRDISREKGFKALVALSGDEGLFYARKYIPKAIILDLQLPVIPGKKLLEILKNSDELRHIPVHIVSALNDGSVDTSSALAFLKKPAVATEIDEAFAFIADYLQSNVKKVLLIAGNNLKSDVINQMFRQRNLEVECDFALSITEGIDKATGRLYNCVITDIGAYNVQKGFELSALHDLLQQNKIPLMVYLDQDISHADEMQLRKVTEVIVRNSSGSNNRLMDELELFLYKVQENKTGSYHSISEKFISKKELKGKNILLVDDDMRNVFALTTALEHEELIVLASPDGMDAIKILRNNSNIDIVLMDIMMPEIDGYETIKKIRSQLMLTNLPIIALTAKAMTGDREKCILAGASDYITKPVDIQKLLSLMRVWLS